MSEKKTIKDYVVAGISFCVIVVPEMLKICLAIFYVVCFFITANIVEKTDPSTLDMSQTMLLGFIYLISPIGAYFFYDKTIVPGLYEELTKYLSKTKSVLKFTNKKEDHEC